MKKISVIGGGAWGTGLSVVCLRAGLKVTLWALEPEVVKAINERRENPLYLPGVALGEDIAATNDLAAASDAEALLFTVPTQFVRAACLKLACVLKPGVPIIICAKGIEQGTNALLSEVAAEVLPNAPLAILSGPTFAAEVARNLPAAVTLASRSSVLRAELPAALSSTFFRIYSTDDIIGAQIGGAVKNVLAIACGIVEGRRMGDNARAALITRGLSEITRLAMAKGARLGTMMGLSGLGDLILTCSAEQSRNFSLGAALGQGQALKDILGKRKSVAEGVFTASSVCGMAKQMGIDMPICQAVNDILNRAKDIDSAITGLLARPTGEEMIIE